MFFIFSSNFSCAANFMVNTKIDIVADRPGTLVSIADFCGSSRKVPDSLVSHAFSRFSKIFSLVLTDINNGNNVRHIITKNVKKRKRSHKINSHFGPKSEFIL